MSLAARGPRVAARAIRQTHRPARRHASDHHGHDHAHGTGESALHLKDANPSGKESLGRGFYMTLAAVPLFYLGYNLAYGSPNNWVARQYQWFKDGKKASADADALHQAVVAQAISDRARLSSYPRETTGPNLKYPEMFNAGSPWNQAAGEGTANMKELEAYYKRVQSEAEEERIGRMRNGKVVSVYN